MSVHDGHRQRMKERFRHEGLDHFSDVQALELLLFYSIPRRDTNLIAHALLKHFGSLSQVLDAAPEELMRVDGITENSATLLHLVTQMGRYYLIDRSSRVCILTEIEDCARYLMPYFFGRRNETVFLLCLDAKCAVLCCKEMGEGTVNATGISIRKIVEAALSVNASAVVLAHNHPSGIAIPSDEDAATTRRLAMALSAVEVVLVDHLVIADGDYVSLVQSGLRLDDCRLL